MVQRRGGAAQMRRDAMEMKRYNIARARTPSGTITVKAHVQSGHFVQQSFRQVRGRREFYAHGGSYGPVKALRLHTTGAVQVLGPRGGRWYTPTRASAVRVSRLFR
jgi:hypothetical protein